MALNANGLLQYQQGLEVVLDIENVDMGIIFETHINRQSCVTFIELKSKYNSPRPFS